MSTPITAPGIRSLAVTVPTILTVAGSPALPPSGTIALSLATQSANQIFAGPTTGSAAAPAFRALVAADLPAGAGSPLTTKGDLYTYDSANARLPIGANNTLLVADSAQPTGNKWSATLAGLTLTQPNIADLTNATHSHQNAAGGGTLNALSIAAGALALARGGTNADLSASGSATAVLAQDASHVVTARALIAADIPSLAASIITSGQLAVARGGTGFDGSATGGANQFVKQTSAAGAFTVAAITDTDAAVAVMIAPGSSTRNVIQPSGDFISLIVRGNASQTVNLQQWQTSTPTVVGSISSIGVTTHIPIDAITAADTNVLILDHSTSGTPSTSFGTSISLRGQDSTTLSQNMGRIRALWRDATHASSKSDLFFTTYLTGVEVNNFRIGSDGFSAFGSGTPVSKLDLFMTSGTNGLSIWNTSPGAAKGWIFYPSTNGSETDLKLYFSGTGAGDRITFVSTGMTLADAFNIVVNTSTGTKIATATTQKLGFYNVTPIAQRSGAAQATVVTTASTQTTPWGFATQAQADAIVTLVNELRNWAVAQGFIKGSA